MDWITESIAIGDYIEAHRAPALRAYGIRSALSLDGTILPEDAKRLGLSAAETHRLEDGPGNDPRRYLDAVDALARLVEVAPPVLVQCHAGRSRSVIVVAGYLMRSREMRAAEAMDFVRRRRPTSVTLGMADLLEWIG